MVIKHNKIELERFLKILPRKIFLNRCQVAALEGINKGLSNTANSEYKQQIETFLQKLEK
jgi:hypothetical protein